MGQVSYRIVNSRDVESTIFTNCLSIRLKVFVDEQKFTEEEEDDGLDIHCQHFLLVSLTCTSTNQINQTLTDEDICSMLAARDPSVVPLAALRQFVDYKPGKVARVAVLPEGRGKGLGSMLVNEAIKWEKERGAVHQLFLHSQYLPKTIKFYEKLGFKRDPDTLIFLEDGMEHVKMILTINDTSN